MVAVFVCPHGLMPIVVCTYQHSSSKSSSSGSSTSSNCTPISKWTADKKRLAAPHLASSSGKAPRIELITLWLSDHADCFEVFHSSSFSPSIAIRVSPSGTEEHSWPGVSATKNNYFFCYILPLKGFFLFFEFEIHRTLGMINHCCVPAGWKSCDKQKKVTGKRRWWGIPTSGEKSEPQK